MRWINMPFFCVREFMILIGLFRGTTSAIFKMRSVVRPHTRISYPTQPKPRGIADAFLIRNLISALPACACAPSKLLYDPRSSPYITYIHTYLIHTYIHTYNHLPSQSPISASQQNLFSSATRSPRRPSRNTGIYHKFLSPRPDRSNRQFRTCNGRVRCDVWLSIFLLSSVRCDWRSCNPLSLLSGGLACNLQLASQTSGSALSTTPEIVAPQIHADVGTCYLLHLELQAVAARPYEDAPVAARPITPPSLCSGTR
jgi:hypothetical protein